MADDFVLLLAGTAMPYFLIQPLFSASGPRIRTPCARHTRRPLHNSIIPEVKPSLLIPEFGRQHPRQSCKQRAHEVVCESQRREVGDHAPFDSSGVRGTE